MTDLARPVSGVLPDKRQVAASFSRAADSYDVVAGLQREAPPRPRTVPETQFLRPDEPGESLPIDEVLQQFF